MTPTPFGNYTLLRRLGKGGMAEVFLARCPSNMDFEKLLAIKRLLPPYNVDKQIIAMLADEARLSIWLNHPNIVQILDFGLEGSTYYLAMEYVEGCDLCDLIRPGGRVPGRPMPLATVLYIFVQLAEALDYAHCRKNIQGEPLKIIHRDVSPHNVLVSREGQIKLADFGLARATISVHQSRAGVVRGKFSYMPKEQALGQEIDHRIDLFALGVSMYEALTGTKPYTSNNLARQLYQLEQPIPPPSALVENLPEEIDDITLQAMSPDVADRYSSAEDLARDLRHALAQRSTFSQEAEHLAQLVSQQLGYPSAPAEPLQVMSLADIKVSHHSLIHSELKAVQEHNSAPPPLPQISVEDATTGPPAPGRPMGAERPEEEDQAEDDDGTATAEYHKPRLPAPPASQQTGGPDPGSPTRLPERAPAPAHDASRESAEVTRDRSMMLDPVAFLINPQDTVRDPEVAGRLAQEALREHTARQHHERFQRTGKKREDRTSRVESTPIRVGEIRRGRLSALLLVALSALVAGGMMGWLFRGSQPPPPTRRADPFEVQGGAADTPRPDHSGHSSAPRAQVTPLRDEPLDGGEAPRADSAGTAAEATPRAAPLDAGAARRSPPDAESEERHDRSPTEVTRWRSPRDPKPAPRRAPPRREESAPRSGGGTLSVFTDVPAQLLLGDSATPMTIPLENLQLKAGIHRIKVISTEDPEISATRWVVLKEGDSKTISVQLMKD